MVSHEKKTSNLLRILVVIVLLYILKELSGLLLPLVLASMITVLVLPLINFLERRSVPHIIITMFIAAISFGIIFFIILFVSGTVEQFIRSRDLLIMGFGRKIDIVIEWLGGRIPGASSEYIREHFNSIFMPANITSLFGTVLSSLGTLSSSSVLFFVYYIILLSSANNYIAYMNYVTGENGSGKVKHVWEMTQQSISAYMGIKTLISLVTGLFTGLICGLFGLQFAILWGILAFLLNYIPSIGSIFSALIPFFMAIIQFDSLASILTLGLLLVACQFIIGSVIDPMIMGNRLRLNTVTVIFSLLFWGYIWGITGMLLSVPLTVVIRLLLENSEDLAIIARIMGKPAQKEQKKLSLFSKIILDSKGESSHEVVS